jgi:hypothetical protein
MLGKQTRILRNPYRKVHDAVGSSITKPLPILREGKARQQDYAQAERQ